MNIMFIDQSLWFDLLCVCHNDAWLKWPAFRQEHNVYHYLIYTLDFDGIFNHIFILNLYTHVPLTDEFC